MELLFCVARKFACPKIRVKTHSEDDEEESARRRQSLPMSWFDWVSPSKGEPPKGEQVPSRASNLILGALGKGFSKIDTADLAAEQEHGGSRHVGATSSRTSLCTSTARPSPRARSSATTTA